MNPNEVRDMLERVGALFTGHFKLSSGRHSDVYVQKQRVFEHPRLTASLGEALAARFSEGDRPAFTVVVSPALGAITFGFAVAYAAHTRFLFTERVDGTMMLRRGQVLAREDRVLVVEDVITTGGSAAEVLAAVEAAGATPVGVGALVDRANTPPRFRLEALLRITASDWDPAECPRCFAGDPLEVPGSRYVAT
ncbi:MAG TPA: orotate phosphoribosyltransferase [Actinomycetota bacterium]